MENKKTGYIFDMKTGELLGTETVWLEKKTGEYPHARNVTLAEPPKAGEHQAAAYKNGEWKLVPDWRGTICYSEEGEQTGVITELGEEPGDRITKTPPAPELYHHLEWDGKDWQTPLDDGFIQDGDQIREKTQEELLDEGKITLADYNEYIRQMREAEYRENTDKIGLMVLRGEATQEEWQEAIQAVKEKWPYKEA